MERTPAIRWVGFVVVLAILGMTMDRVRGHVQAHAIETATYEDMYYIPPPQWLRVMSLGYDEALAGLLWCKVLVYFGEEVVHRGDIEHIFEYTDAILALDPMFKRVYRWAGTAGIYRPTATGVPEVRRSLSYLERASSLFPDDGDLAWDTGATIEFELLPLLPKDDDEIPKLHEEGVRYLETAARMGAGPAWLVLTNATSLRKLGRNEQALRHLEEMYATVQDASTRQQIRTQIESLRSASYAEALERTASELRRHHAADFPYLDETLYLLVGRRPPIDGMRLLIDPFRASD
ncbi:MAG: hypothetical protein R3A78_01560 [Polyangiales bacterium]